MRWFSRLLFCIALLGLAPLALSLDARAQKSPDVIVREIYATYGDNGLGISPTDPEIRDMFSQRLQALLAEEDGRIRRDGLGRLDFDVFVDGQDFNVTDVTVGRPKIDGTKASVDVSLRNFDEPRQFRFLFVNEDGMWCIDDIVAERASDPWKLTALLNGG